MAKALIIGDPHLKITRFDLVKEFLAWVKLVVLKENPDIVINTGDTFHNHAVLRSEIMKEFWDHAYGISISRPYYYILGNHDQFKPDDSKYHALQSFDFKNFYVIEERTDIEHLNMTMVPYIHDFNEFPLETLPICVAHQQFVGCDYGYYRPDVGTDADKGSADIIISGHIHKRQMFGKVIYPGTPFAQSVNDIDESKGVMIFDTETYEYSFIECPLPGWRGLKFDLTDNDTIETVHQHLSATLDDKNHWIVSLKGTKVDINTYIGSDRCIKLREGKDVEFRREYTDKQKRDKIVINRITNEGVVKEYLDKVYTGSVNKDTIYTKALEMLNK